MSKCLPSRGKCSAVKKTILLFATTAVKSDLGIKQAVEELSVVTSLISTSDDSLFCPADPEVMPPPQKILFPIAILAIPALGSFNLLAVDQELLGRSKTSTVCDKESKDRKLKFFAPPAK